MPERLYGKTEGGDTGELESSWLGKLIRGICTATVNPVVEDVIICDPACSDCRVVVSTDVC